jgi:enoyl-CoA hydratase
MTEPIAVTYERRGAIALVTLRRAEQLNALSSTVVRALDAVIGELERQSDVRVIVVTGHGKAFSAGADIKEFSALDGPIAFRGFIELLQRTLRRLEQMAQPSIAAVNGIAFGGGLELAMACDLRIADPKARLGLPEIKLGLLPGAGGTQRLPRLVPSAVAAEIILTGNPVDASQALQIGLVNAVSEPGQSVERALALAETIAARAPLALTAAKRLRDQAAALPLDAGLQLERETVTKLFGTNDRVEGTAAFVEKRDPRFSGS